MTDTTLTSKERLRDAEHLLRRAREKLQSDWPNDQYLLKCIDGWLSNAPETSEPCGIEFQDMGRGPYRCTLPKGHGFHSGPSTQKALEPPKVSGDVLGVLMVEEISAMHDELKANARRARESNVSDHDLMVLIWTIVAVVFVISIIVIATNRKP